jgi:hypothetical protein
MPISNPLEKEKKKKANQLNVFLPPPHILSTFGDRQFLLHWRTGPSAPLPCEESLATRLAHCPMFIRKVT